jgi:hypothetical protein
MDAIRTPAEFLEGLPDFPFAPHYRHAGEPRLARVDEGEGPPVMFFQEDAGPELGRAIADWPRA